MIRDYIPNFDVLLLMQDMTRTFSPDPSLLDTLGRLRALAVRKNWLQAPKETGPCRVPLRELLEIEEEFRTVLPDPIVAYLAAGISVWGDGPTTFAKVKELTLALREEKRHLRKYVIVDDDSNGNYIAVAVDAARDSDEVVFLDHEGGFRPSSRERLSSRIERTFGELLTPASPVILEIVDEPAKALPITYVHHPKFGRGHMLGEDGEIVRVLFEGVGEKRIKRSFLAFDLE